MKSRNLLISTVIFLAGLAAGSAVTPLIQHAQAGEIDWTSAAQDPEFRNAVIEVINSCIVDNAIIYCG